MSTTPYVLQSAPGIKRDGTQFEGEHYTGGRWCRFNRGKPRKMSGYRSVSDQVTATVRGMHAQSAAGYTYVHFGSSTKLEQLTIDNTTRTASGSLFDRTPAGFVVESDTTWQMDSMFNPTSSAVAIFAHPAPNLTDIDSETARNIYYGDLTSGAALAALGKSVCGGVCVLHPYLFTYCKGGLIEWSPAGDPLNVAGYNEARVASTKIIKGLPLRAGPGNAPAGLFWSLETLVRAVFVGGTPVFQFDTIGDISVLSSHAIVEYDGRYFWPGTDRFFVFNGTVQELPNDLNRDWFFDGLTLSQRQKVFAFTIPRWGEIWWCYPRGVATECTHAVIYNVRLNTWYYTELPLNMRSHGVYAKVFGRPLLTDASPSGGKVKLWVHESGWDELDGTTSNPINSYFETSDLSLLVSGQKPMDTSLYCDAIEPDFVQVGQMYCRLLGRANSRSKIIEGPLKTFEEVATSQSTQILPIKQDHRQMRFQFGSNTIGGKYELGQTLVHLEPASGRRTGATAS